MSNISEQEWFRQEPEDPLDRWRREKAEQEEPQPRERRLDTPQLTLECRPGGVALCPDGVGPLALGQQMHRDAVALRRRRLCRPARLRSCTVTCDAHCIPGSRRRTSRSTHPPIRGSSGRTGRSFETA
jgi:hypothetical protein